MCSCLDTVYTHLRPSPAPPSSLGTLASLFLREASCSAFNASPLSAETARAVLRPVTWQFRRLTLRVAGEFSRLTSAQCLCLPRRPVSPPAGVSARLDSILRDVGTTTRRPLVHSVRPHAPFLFTRAFLRFCIPPRPLRSSVTPHRANDLRSCSFPGRVRETHVVVYSTAAGTRRGRRKFDSAGQQLIGMCGRVKLPS